MFPKTDPIAKPTTGRGQMACPTSSAPTDPTVAPAAPETLFVTSRLKSVLLIWLRFLCFLNLYISYAAKAPSTAPVIRKSCSSFFFKAALLAIRVSFVHLFDFRIWEALQPSCLLALLHTFLQHSLQPVLEVGSCTVESNYVLRLPLSLQQLWRKKKREQLLKDILRFSACFFCHGWWSYQKNQQKAFSKHQLFLSALKMGSPSRYMKRDARRYYMPKNTPFLQISPKIDTVLILTLDNLVLQWQRDFLT